MMLKKISNVSSTLIVNLYEGFYLPKIGDTSVIQEKISNKYNSNKLINIARDISKTIETEILNESSHTFQPFGDSGSMLIQADLSLLNSATLHLEESHITFHTYVEDILKNHLIVRLEFHISSCSEANVYTSLLDIFQNNNNCNSLLPDLVSIDYLRRGAKFGGHSEDILNVDCDITDIKLKNIYHILSNKNFMSSSNTKNHVLLLNMKDMIDKLQTENSFLSIKSIHQFRSFLLRSYASEYDQSELIDLEYIK